MPRGVRKRKTPPEPVNNGNKTAAVQNDLTNTNRKTTKIAKKRKRKSNSNSCNAFDEILKDIKLNTEREKILSQYESELLAIQTPEKSPPKEITIQKFDISPLVFTPKKTPQTGLRIIDHKNYKRFFASAEDLIRVGLGPSRSDARCNFEHALIENPQRIAKLVSTIRWPGGPYSNSLMAFLFLLMSIEENRLTIHSYHNFLLHAAKLNQIAEGHTWVPSLQDIAIALLNYGFKPEKNCPLLGLMKAAKRSLKEIVEKHMKKIADFSSLPKVVTLHNIGVVFDLISKLTKLGMYTDEVLAQLVMLSSWVSLDPHTRHIRKQLMASLNVLLNAISPSGWESKWLLQLSVSLSQPSNREEDVKSIYTLLGSFGRSLSLKKVISYHAAHICLDAPYTFEPVVRPVDVLKLLESYPLTKLIHKPGLFLVLLSHLATAVGNVVHASDVTSIKKLVTIAQFCSSKIVDSIHSLDSSLVKSRLCALYCKWTALAQELNLQRNSSWRYNFESEEESLVHSTSDVSILPSTPLRKLDDLNSSLPTPSKVYHSPGLSLHEGEKEPVNGSDRRRRSSQKAKKRPQPARKLKYKKR